MFQGKISTFFLVLHEKKEQLKSPLLSFSLIRSFLEQILSLNEIQRSNVLSIPQDLINTTSRK